MKKFFVSVFTSVYKDLYRGQRFDFTKIYNQYSVILAVPTAMGLPFIYDLNTPTLLSIEGEAKLKFYPQPSIGRNNYKIPDAVNASAAVHFVYVYF